MNQDLLRGIANSDHKKNLVAYLKEVQDYVADIRNGSYSNETRITVVDVIEKQIISKIKMASGEVSKNIDDYK